MKKTVFGLAVAFGALMTVTSAQSAPQFSESQLQELNNDHIRVVRQAQRSCSTGGYLGGAGGGRSGCVIGSVERHLDTGDHVDLYRFHRQLPLRQRYNSERSFSETQKYFE